jgi:GNAT superfamily N-acetyltransferase
MIEYHIDPQLSNEALNGLFENAWPDHTHRDFSRVLAGNLGHVSATAGGVLVGFVNIAWDGDRHAFLLDPTVRSGFRRQGIGTELIRRAIDLARFRGVEWLHVDYEPHLAGFYAGAGFRPTEAGLVHLKADSTGPGASDC